MSAAPRIRAAVILPVALLLGTMPVARAARQDGGPVTRVERISPFVDAERSFRIVVRVVNASPEPLTDVTMEVTVHPRIFSRSQLRSSIDTGPASVALSRFTQTLEDPIEPGARARIILDRPVDRVAAFTQTGVYPVRIAVRAGGSETVSNTAVPVLRSSPETQLNVSWLLPVDRPTALRGDGTYDPDALAALQAGALRAQMDALAARPGIPLTLVPSGDLVDMLADLSDGATVTGPDGSIEHGADSELAFAAGEALIAMREAARVVGEVATTSYANADLSALAVNGLGGEVVRQLTASRAAIERHLGRTPTFRFLAPAGATLGRAETETLATLGIEQLLLDPAILAEQPQTPEQFPGLRYDLFGPSRPIVARAGQQRFGALLIEPDLRARLSGDAPSVLLAQALIAETAASWLEIPLLAPDRLLVIAAEHVPPPAALAAALDGMAAAPWIKMRTASDALGALLPEGEPVQLPQRRPSDTPYLAAARDARGALATLEAMTVQPHPRTEQLSRMALLAQSQEWRDDPGTGVELARAASEVTAGLASAVRVAEGRVVTLTSRTGALPVTVLNEGPIPVRVRVRLESAKAAFPDGDTRTIDLSGQTTLDFEVEARAAGSFPVNVFIETTDGRLRLARGSVVMRSTAVSAVALAAIGGGILVLVAASFRRKRRSEKAAG